PRPNRRRRPLQHRTRSQLQPTRRPRRFILRKPPLAPHADPMISPIRHAPDNCDSQVLWDRHSLQRPTSFSAHNNLLFILLRMTHVWFFHQSSNPPPVLDEIRVPSQKLSAFPRFMSHASYTLVFACWG